MKSNFTPIYPGVFLVARNLDDGVIGFIQGNVRHDGDATLSALYLIPDVQGRGVGFQLFSRAVIELRKRGCKRLSLRTFMDCEDAVRFYGKVMGVRSTAPDYRLGNNEYTCASFDWDLTQLQIAGIE